MADIDQITMNKITYEGLFDFQEFYESLTNILKEYNYDIDEADHKSKPGLISFIWDNTKNVDEYSRFRIWFRCETKIRGEVEVDDNGRKRKMQQGTIYILFKGFIVTDYGGRWEGNPYLVFLKGFFDKYLYGKQGSPALAKGVYSDWVSKLAKDVTGVINEVRSFLQLYKK